MSDPTATTTVDAAALTRVHAGPDRPRLLDVRSPAEFNAGHIPGSVNLPLPELDRYATRLARASPAASTRDMVVVCQSGVRSARAVTMLRRHGHPAAASLDGGILAWANAGGPVDSAPGGWAMERQVRFTAGALVAGSVAISVRVRAARFLAGAVGAGLVFSALTDSCAMAAALQRLPHNRGRRRDHDRTVALLTT